MTDRTVELINAAYRIAEAAQPITVRGVAYKLFVQGLIPSMSKEDVRAGAYRPLLKAREAGIIPWDWIVDETRSLEKTATWDEPEELAEELATGYRKEFWNQQPVRCEVWSEKGTVRGLLQPVLEKYGVGFRVMHGYSSATVVYEVSQRAKREGKELAALYVGDRDPSGLDMSERDLPKRIAKDSKYRPSLCW
jgi:hypothetical protein